ncbi:Aste57867_11410 [Aphanomyces stellatus]|uniref:Aste57867_11410 protein n=1 Tax=Aphanomyces stellatus TaxID=120398 RepID=A0A485KTE8_9STRA|nr:hypothetical protein As57867_011368 [Aphanomyces stellatus]VFT88271.1 Aste57867_11410 [Aphanomyces stellatus]
MSRASALGMGDAGTPVFAAAFPLAIGRVLAAEAVLTGVALASVGLAHCLAAVLDAELSSVSLVGAIGDVAPLAVFVLVAFAVKDPGQVAKLTAWGRTQHCMWSQMDEPIDECHRNTNYIVEPNARTWAYCDQDPEEYIWDRV